MFEEISVSLSPNWETLVIKDAVGQLKTSVSYALQNNSVQNTWKIFV